jgi:hypothetical protein
MVWQPEHSSNDQGPPFLISVLPLQLFTSVLHTLWFLAVLLLLLQAHCHHVTSLACSSNGKEEVGRAGVVTQMLE